MLGPRRTARAVIPAVRRRPAQASTAPPTRRAAERLAARGSHAISGSACAVLATVPVIEPVAVADVEALLAAIPPDRELHEPGENGWEGRIERTGVDLLGSTGNDFGACGEEASAEVISIGYNSGTWWHRV